MSGQKHSDKSLLARQTGGNGYYLGAAEVYDASLNGDVLVMNIDLLDEDGTTFSALEAIEESEDRADYASATVLVGAGETDDMNISGIALPNTIRNFTYGVGFSKVTADKAVWLNLENKM